MEPICFNCARRLAGKLGVYALACEAYPGGVPDEILIGEADHTKPHDGDNGLQFKRREEIGGHRDT